MTDYEKRFQDARKTIGEIDEEIVLLSNDETHERIKEKMNNLWT